MKLDPLKYRLVGTDVAHHINYGHHTPESECECQMFYLKSNAMTFRIFEVWLKCTYTFGGTVLPQVLAQNQVLD